MLPFFGFILAGVAKLVTSLGMAIAYESEDNGTGLAIVSMTFTPHGTWTIEGGGNDTVTGSPTSGVWLDPSPSYGSGSGYEIQYVTSALVNSPTINNGASSYSTLDQNRTISVQKSTGTASADVTINLRRRGGSAPFATTVQLTAIGHI